MIKKNKNKEKQHPNLKRGNREKNRRKRQGGNEKRVLCDRDRQ